MEKIKLIKTAVSPEEERPVQVRVDDVACYTEFEDGSVKVTRRKAIVFAFGR